MEQVLLIGAICLFLSVVGCIYIVIHEENKRNMIPIKCPTKKKKTKK